MKTLSDLLDRALALEGEARTQWLDQLDTGPHAALSPLVKEMLAKRSDMGTRFLSHPLRINGLTDIDAVARALPRLEPEARIGAYTLVRELGRGGMGVVWLAERSDGQMRRQVALKLPVLSASDALAERFVRERNILSQLEHPNIARLYDAGVSDAGQPFLALEYVVGEAITAHCDRKQLSVRERLQRFLDVTRAVQYAHANLIIHRDLKPNNILVTEDGAVRLLDFGIAKLIDDAQSAAVETELTLMAGRALTVDYASPEQVQGRAIGTASDVYSLGVILYQLLCGDKPYSIGRENKFNAEKLLNDASVLCPSERAVKDNAADPKSTKNGVSNASDSASISRAAARRTTPERLARSLSGDLDTIVAKAMRKAPSERYGTVAEFAADIERYLRGLPVLAQPESWRYKTGKFIRRNRVIVGAATAVACSVVAGLSVALWQTSVARDAAARADREATLAKRETERGNAVQSFLVELFAANSNDQKNAVQVRNLTAKQLLDRGAEKLERGSALSNEVKAVLFRQFGELYENLSDFQRSIAFHQQSVDAASLAHGKQSKYYALALMELAWVRAIANGGDRPMELIDEAKEILLKTAPGSEELAQALYFEADFASYNDPKRAVIAATESVRLLQLAGGTHRRKAFAQRALAYAHLALGNADLAIASFQDAISSFVQLYGADGIEVGITKGDLGRALRLQLRLAEAEQVVHEGVEILKAFRGARADSEGFGQLLVRLRVERGNYQSAHKVLQDAYDSLRAADATPSDRKSGLAIVLVDIALARGELDRANELILRHLTPVSGGYSTIQAAVLIRAARIALERTKPTEARHHVEEVKKLELREGLPFDLLRDAAAISSEVVAAEGDLAGALAEFNGFLNRFPVQNHSLLSRFLVDLSKARIYASHQRWREVDAALGFWKTNALAHNQQIPAHMKGELALLVGEAGRKLGSPDTEKWLRDAKDIFERAQLLNSKRYLRAKQSLGELSTSKSAERASVREILARATPLAETHDAALNEHRMKY